MQYSIVLFCVLSFLPGDGHLEFFQYLAIMNEAVMNILVSFGAIYTFLKREDLLGHKRLFSFSR